MNYTVFFTDYCFAYNKSRVSPSKFLTNRTRKSGGPDPVLKQKYKVNFNKNYSCFTTHLKRVLASNGAGQHGTNQATALTGTTCRVISVQGDGDQKCKQNCFLPINNVSLSCQNLLPAKETKEPAERSLMYLNVDTGYWAPPPHVLYLCHRNGAQTILCVVFIMDSAL